jgi:hypothetical protein
VSECVAAFEALYGRENREADERGHRVEVGDGAAAILREDWREGLRDREGAEEVHFHLLSPALDPLRIGEVAAEEADDARVVDEEVDVRRGRGGGGDLRALVTSSWSGTTREPWRSTSGSSVEMLRAAAYTLFTPAATSASTMASPMPRLAPVTSAVLPESA